MAVGTAYQGAWQGLSYQGAWQIQSQELTKSVSDALGIADSVSLGIGKPFTEAFGMSDAAALGLAKVFAESLGISDSILITSGLLFSDAMSIGDAIVLEFGLNILDQQGISDSLAFDFGMNLSDAFGIADTFLVGTALYFSDSLTIADTIDMVRGFGIELTDTLSIGDSIALMLSKSLSEAMGLGDNVAFAVGKGLSDSLGISDAKVISMGKGLSDIVSITDALYKALTIGEQIVGLKRIAEVLANAPDETQAWMPYIGIGSSDIAGDEETETTLWTELHRKLGAVTVRANTYFIRATFGQDEPTGDSLTIKEVGIFDAASGGKLGKRWVLDNDESKDNIDEIVVECAVTILHGSDRTAFDLGLTLAPGSEETGEGGESPRAPGDAMGIADSLAMSLGHGLILPDMGSGVDNLGIADSLNVVLGKGLVLPDMGDGAEVLGITDSLVVTFGHGLVLPDMGSGVDNLSISEFFSIDLLRRLTDSVEVSDSIDLLLTPPGVPVLGVDPLLLDFGTEDTEEEVTVTNEGTGALEWDVVCPLSVTDAVIDGTTTVTSVTGGFTPQMVGFTVTIETVGDFVIMVIINTNTIVVDRAAEPPGIGLTLTVNTWLLPDIASGILPPGWSTVVTVTVDRTDLDADVYNEVLEFTSNDGNIDVPVAMTVAGAVPGPGGAAPAFNDVLVDGDYMYCACMHTEGDGILIFDITDKANPARVGWVVQSAAYYPIRLAKSGSILYATTPTGLYSVNVVNPAAPVELDFIELCPPISPSPRVAIDGSRAYVNTVENGLQLINISDPSDMSKIANDFDVGVMGTWYYSQWNEALLYCREDIEGVDLGPHQYFWGLYSCEGGGVTWGVQADFLWDGGIDIKVSDGCIYLDNGRCIWRLTLGDYPALDWIYDSCKTAFGATSNSFDVNAGQIHAHVIGTGPEPFDFIQPMNGAQALIGACAMIRGPNSYTSYGKTVYEPALQMAYIVRDDGLSIVDTTIPSEIGTIELAYGSRGVDATATNIYLCEWNIPGGHRVNIYDITAPHSPASPSLVGVAN